MILVNDIVARMKVTECRDLLSTLELLPLFLPGLLAEAITLRENTDLRIRALET